MSISTEEEQISLPLANQDDLLKSAHGDSNQDSGDEVPPASESAPKSPCVLTDVNVVPEREKDQIEHKIAELLEEIATLRSRERSLNEKRREALNKILDIKGCIRVFCRVRPYLSTDKKRMQQPISVESEKIVVRSGGTRKEFGFDKVFTQEASQEDVFVEVEPIIRSALDGHNVCILAYGQTGTGKTFTMDGTNETPGIVPRVLDHLFRHASLDVSNSYTFSISMLEVYLGSLRDLLAPKSSSRTYAVSRCNLNIQTDSKGSVEIEGLTEIEISNVTKASWWYTKGRKVRSTSWTIVNEASSRSHCLTRITIYRHGDASETKAEVSKLWMVDLGGSERLLKTGATGQTLDEGRAINLSLSALGDVIAALRRKRGHVPYRNSKLTQILRDSLGDGSRVLMLVHVSPYEEDVGETTCSFTFAKRARAVECNKELTEELKKQKERRISDLEEEIRGAENEHQFLRTQIQNAELLLSEKKKLFAVTNQPLEDEGSPKEGSAELSVTPKTPEKTVKKTVGNSLPRFMSSTAASRQRKTVAEKEIATKAKSLRSTARSSIQISSFQSINYSDPRVKLFLRSSHKKSRYADSKSSLAVEDANCNSLDTKPSAVPRGKAVSSSDSNLRATLHKRRMSDLL